MNTSRESRFSQDASSAQDLGTAASAAAVLDPEKAHPSTPEAEQENSNTAEPKVTVETWGRHGKVILWIGIALMWIVFELDHATVYNYQNYAASEFNRVSLLGALTTAGVVVSAVLKPPIARISNVVGRAQTYCAVVIFYIISYVICASSTGFDIYAGGYVIYCVGQSGMQILNQIIVADITTSRWRGLANGLVNLPFIVIPWVAAFAVDSALANIGWRWGIGMFAIILPACSLVIIIPLFYFQQRTKKAGGIVRIKVTFKSFFSEVDLGGMILLSGGLAMILLPLALAGSQANGWNSRWIPPLMVIGGVFLIVLVFYEKSIATRPAIPPRFVHNISLVLAWIIGLLDSFSYSVTHTYMYAWATVTHNFSARDATFLTYTAGALQVFTGLIAGVLMYRSRRYKWLLVIGVVIRLIGYGVMMRLRGSNNSSAELFIVQVIQGAGSGLVGSVVIVVAQVVVNREELAQATALELLFIYLGNAIGSAVAGGIYTNSFRDRLRLYLPDVPDSVIEGVYDSITERVPDSGTSERVAVNRAYSDILRYMTIAALVSAAVPMLLCWFLPNFKLNDNHNLADNLTEDKKDESDSSGNEQKPAQRRYAKLGRWRRQWLGM